MKKKVKRLKFNRALVMYVVIMLCLGICIFQTGLINIRHVRTASGSKSSRSIEVSKSRGLIYDRNLNRLVCDETENVCVLKPTVSSLSLIKASLSGEEYVEAVNSLGRGNLLLYHSAYEIKSKDTVNLKIYKRYNNQLASHLVGVYSDVSGKGLSGIEKSFDDYLNSFSGILNVRYFANGSGEIFQGGELQISDNGYNSVGGVCLTIDKNIQSMLEKAVDSNGLKKGCAIAVDISDGSVVAAVSRPDFDRNNISLYLNDKDAALFNRALGAYPVGSIFKPLIAAAALEQGIAPETEFVCNGNIKSGGVTFHCMKSHGNMNMASALVYSCNCYFVNLIKKLDISEVLSLAESLGFGNEIELADGLLSYSGNLPDLNQLDNDAEKANFSFGQGYITATSLQIASLYCAIANSGKFYKPYLIKGWVDGNGVYSDSDNKKPAFKVFDKKTAEMLSSFLELAVREGTGKNAESEYCDVAGKTATAQTGEFNNGTERLVTWFAGFFPYNKPEYVVAIMCEDGESGSIDCAPVFSDFVNALTEYEQHLK